jgi:tRNA dimethylallyltransferase
MASNMSARIWLIAGPTASGKSALALRLAEETGGEIVNADAIQLYADLWVLSARPSPGELARAPHHLFGVADAADGWSVGRWLRAALPIIEAIQARGRPAIVVGGTGLYFLSLTRGLAEAPPISIAANLAARRLYDEAGEAAVRERLQALDPKAEARIGPNDRQRLTRALAVATATGRPLSAWQADTRPALAEGDWRGVVLAPPRETLHARCDARFWAMVAAGGVQEAARLDARGLDATLPALKAVGLRELAAHARGDIELPEAVAAAQAATRQYAKRQTTWFRNQTPRWPRIDAVDADDQWRQFLALEPGLTRS